MMQNIITVLVAVVAILVIVWLFRVGFMKKVWDHAVDYVAKRLAVSFVIIATLIIIGFIISLTSK
jgi:hypothetical protein